ncbi:unnamed protein product [Thlaspi arvense]|uniref:Leucine-rich repeat-containing N-terminal plant-type domain-containing protein n=1 Tax=Thlaspi arvense TaxID=13288 RepID=A0AAU9SKD1_THLAR|nr:unnamed protein product [Thlaspi arvense]
MMIRNHCYCFSGVIGILSSILIHGLASPRLHFCRHDQRETLLEFKDEFRTGETFPSSWNKSSDCCLWEGVECDHKSGQVISLALSDKSLNGSLKTNSSLFNLQYLRELSLYNCNLQGMFPSSLGTLSRLTFVGLRGNALTGEIPSSLGNLSRLETLELGNNHLLKRQFF